MQVLKTGGKNGSFYSIGEKYQKLQTKLSSEKIFSAISLCRHACENGKGNWSDNRAHRSKAVHGLFTVGGRHTNAAFHYLFLFLIFNFFGVYRGAEWRRRESGLGVVTQGARRSAHMRLLGY